MTKEICWHHVVLGVYSIGGILSFIFTVLGGMEFSKFNWQVLPCCSQTNTYDAWLPSFNAMNHFYMSLVALIFINVFCLLLLNIQYRWIALKECSN